MATRDPTDWMWTSAVELLEQAERMHRQFFRLSAAEQPRLTWEPPVDMFEDDDGIVILVALPGVPADRVEVSYDRGTLLVRAERQLPFSGTRHAVRQLEIPYGYFERRIPLAHGHLDGATRELIDGCLILRLRKSA